MIPVLQTSDWRILFTIAFIKHFKVPNLSLFAARQAILPPLSLILIEQTDYKFIAHLKDENSAALQFCEMTNHFPYTILQLIFLY